MHLKLSDFYFFARNPSEYVRLWRMVMLSKGATLFSSEAAHISSNQPFSLTSTLKQTSLMINYTSHMISWFQHRDMQQNAQGCALVQWAREVHLSNMQEFGNLVPVYQAPSVPYACTLWHFANQGTFNVELDLEHSGHLTSGKDVGQLTDSWISNTQYIYWIKPPSRANLKHSPICWKSFGYLSFWYYLMYRLIRYLSVRILQCSFFKVLECCKLVRVHSPFYYLNGLTFPQSIHLSD